MNRHAWMPVSPCGPGCLSGQEPTVGRVLRVLRITAVVLVVLLSLVSLLVLPFIGGRGRNRVTKTIFRGVLLAMGVTLVARGVIPGPGRGALVVNNHTSWLDIVAVNAVRPMCAVAKRDIASWPVLGWLVSAAGSVYVDREGLRSLPDTVGELADALRAGSMVNVTPEGTTWCGLTHGRFRPAMFQAAIDGGVPVLPVALRFRRADGTGTTAPAFIGDETIIESVRRTAALKGLVLEVHVGAEIAPGRAADRHELAAMAEQAVDAVLMPAMPATQHALTSGSRQQERLDLRCGRPARGSRRGRSSSRLPEVTVPHGRHSGGGLWITACLGMVEWGSNVRSRKRVARDGDAIVIPVVGDHWKVPAQLFSLLRGFGTSRISWRNDAERLASGDRRGEVVRH